MSFETFTLKDAEGREHLYEIIPHSTRQGQRIFWRLVALGAEPLAAAFSGDAIVKALSGKADTSALAQELNLDAIAGQVRQVVLSQDLPELAEELFAHASRDGEPLKGLAFDQAYQKNWMEYGLALWNIIRINQFFPLPATS